MEQVFRVDEQDFISRPICFRDFLNKSSRVSARLDSILSHSSVLFPEDSSAVSARVASAAARLNQLPSRSIEFTELGNVLENTIPLYEHISMRTLEFIKLDNILRKNPQYKSAAMRAMKYDGINPTLLSKTQKKEDKPVDVEKRECKEKEEETAKQTEVGEGQTELEKNDIKEDVCESPVLTNTDTNNSATGHSNTRVNQSKYIWNPHDDMDVIVIDRDDNTNSFSCSRLPNNKDMWNPIDEMDGLIAEQPTNSDRNMNTVSQPVIANDIIKHETPNDNNLIACVSIYMGYNRCLEKVEQRLGRLLKVAFRLYLLGSNTLSDLKRSFFCAHDNDFSVNAMEQRPKLHDMHKFRFPSSFFFIGDTFYVDTMGSDPTGISLKMTDISEPIRSWATDRGLGVYKVASIHETKVIDLVTRLGQPFVYVHQGTCEHLVCFTDLRLRTAADLPGFYPINLVERKFRRKMCRACNVETAEWIVKNCRMLPSDSFYICTECLLEVCFDSANQPIDNYELIPYCDRQALSESDVYMTTIISRLEKIGQVISGEFDGGFGKEDRQEEQRLEGKKVRRRYKRRIVEEETETEAVSVAKPEPETEGESEPEVQCNQSKKPRITRKVSKPLKTLESLVPVNETGLDDAELARLICRRSERFSVGRTNSVLTPK
ncbi:hypothetical protein WR25_22458 isoform A [Diploscapter pachys]|uniref:snRNA-activating protein complex subunit 3 n=1 Tax=Diploscapter pachys TaxID=2018661 RepID=A0A2A2KDX5_9BILA|nr:hypothetical protein WR25_22458 isoform A [Diploscapter pachys]